MGVSRLGNLLPTEAALLLIAGFSVAGTHDYLSWNRARWLALKDLMRDNKVTPKNIDGGYEFNGWYTWPNAWVPRAGPGRSWWVLYDDKYVVSFGRTPGVLDLRRYPYERWMPVRETDYIHLGRAIDPWVVPSGAHWVLKHNPFIDRAVVCRGMDSRMGTPLGVTSTFPIGTKSIVIAFKTKPGEGKVDIQVPTYRNGQPAGVGSTEADHDSIAFLKFDQKGGVPAGSYRFDIMADGINIRLSEFAVTPTIENMLAPGALGCHR